MLLYLNMVIKFLAGDLLRRENLSLSNIAYGINIVLQR